MKTYWIVCVNPLKELRLLKVNIFINKKYSYEKNYKIN